MVQAENGVAQQAYLLQRTERLARMGSWRLALDTRQVTWSDGMYRLFGIEPDAFSGDLGEVVSRAIHPDDREMVDRINAAVTRDRVPAAADYRIILPDGSIRWVHTEGTQETGADGGVVALVGFVQDNTEQHAAAEKVREAEAAFEATFEQSAVGMAHVGIDGSWLAVNQRLCDMLGYTRQELMGLTFADITDPDDVEDNVEHLHRLLEGTEDVYDTKKRYVRKDGALTWVRLSVALIRDVGGEPLYLVDVIEDITDEKNAEIALEASELRFLTELQEHAAELEHLATHDALTGLENRRAFLAALERALALARRGTPSMLLFMDIDHFKRCNDERGHAFGDKALSSVASLLKKEVREVDLVARVGGDEFATLLAGSTEAGASAVAKRMRTSVEALGVDIGIPLGLSIGIVSVGADGSAERILSAGDQRMYEYKAAHHDAQEGTEKT